MRNFCLYIYQRYSIEFFVFSNINLDALFCILNLYQMTTLSLINDISIIYI